MPYTIQEVSQITGLSSHTLRYYEQAGLMPPIERADNGYRQYTDNDIGWLEIITCLRGTNMPIADIRRYAELSMMGDHTAGERCTLLQSHRQQILQEIEQLHRYLAKVEGKIDYYRSLEETDYEYDTQTG